ncbi:MAG: rhamnogalacturonan lyase [Sedimentisphaerales bacterium]|nr:rhamnogalacturonan lyase [Sedimentisphaerales bacterium]
MKQIIISIVIMGLGVSGFFLTGIAQASRHMENLDRGIVAVYLGDNQVYIGWRMFGIDPETIAFNVYRGSTKINTDPITGSTNYTDNNGSLSSTYSVRPVIGNVEQTPSQAVSPWSSFVHVIPLQAPPDSTTPDNVSFTYRPNDCSVGDVDGDGQYEIILKWDPSNSKDNSHSGYTGNVLLDAYKMDGTFLWRIDLGINIRAGAHYTQFMVYDLDSDGKAEIACKTAPGTVDGLRKDVILPGDNPDADYRNSSGYILDGPEYFTIFDGQTGKALSTANYIPPRDNVSDWGDSYGNRVDRFLACVAYLDGQQPSIVMCRGYYTRTVLAAWNWRKGRLSNLWVFDTDKGYSRYAGQGNHNLSIGDVDGDGADEIIYGAIAVDNDGTGLYTTGLGHGDVMHLSDMDPDRPGLEVWDVHETASGAGAGEFRDARTGELIWGWSSSGDTGRGLAAHIDPRYRGYQFWSSSKTGVYDKTNTQISANQRLPYNFAIWWDGDLQRELLDRETVYKWDWVNGRIYRLINLKNYNAQKINGSKSTPCLSADILGDWREEVIFRHQDNTKIMVFTTITPTDYRFYTLMHDPQYRLAIAWQNVGYNQPPHPGFYIGKGMSAPPRPDIVLVGTGILPDNDTTFPTPHSTK